MYHREITSYLKEVSNKYPVLTLIGPRQSGKSTLARNLFKAHTYVSLEETDIRLLATEDPRGFFKKYPSPLIIDEVQRVPSLLSYIQSIVDEPGSKAHFVLTGSHQLLLMEKITQSLAGRTVIAKLLPFSRREINPHHPTMSLDETLFKGGYPRIYDKNLEPMQWLQQYYESYVERDVRNLIRLTELDLFQRFISLCAGRAGQLVNFSSLANDCGLSPPTARSWLSVLQTSFICFTLQPHFRNFNKRIVKTPKIYFFDTGLLCYLLKIQNTQTLSSHPLRGNIFENWVISEWVKSFLNRGLNPPLYFWRDTKGNEVDLIEDRGTSLYPIEIKSAATFHPDFIKNLTHFNEIQGLKELSSPHGECCYGGEGDFSFKDYRVRSWQEV